MVGRLVILCLLAYTVRAEWYTATMPDGSVVTVPVRTDPSLMSAVGGVVTSRVLYIAPAVIDTNSPAETLKRREAEEIALLANATNAIAKAPATTHAALRAVLALIEKGQQARGDVRDIVSAAKDEAMDRVRDSK